MQLNIRDFLATIVTENHYDISYSNDLHTTNFS